MNENEIDKILKSKEGLLICLGHSHEKYVLCCPACLQKLISPFWQEKLKKYWGFNASE